MKKAFVILFILTLTASAYAESAYQFISPVPNSELNSREATIIIRNGDWIDQSSVRTPDLIQVIGEESGPISGEVILSKDGKTVIFKPDRLYAPGEVVHVTLSAGLQTRDGHNLPGETFFFKITPQTERLKPADYLTPELLGVAPEYVPPVQTTRDSTVPDDFPPIITHQYGETGEGNIFLTVSREVEGTGFYIMMIDNDGCAVYYRELPDDYAYNFRVHSNGQYSYSQFLEHHTYTGGGDVIHMIMDPSFTIVDSFQMGNGYIAEAHGFQLLANGHALLFGYDLQLIDMTEYGGWPNALMAGTVVQELDQDKNVVFQWRSWDHYALTDTYGSLTRRVSDPVHINSIFPDSDGHILVTSNGLSEATKINRQTGEIIWRLSGKNNQFEFLGGDDAPIRRGLHNISRLENGHILLFDNSPQGQTNASGRAVEYALDEENMTATLVWAYANDPPIYALRRGSAQRLPNGNTVIGWGSASDNDSIAVTEVTPDGNVVFELKFAMEGMSSYRAYRFPMTDWTPSASVTELEVSAGSTYEFIDDAYNTGVSIHIDDLDAEGYNELTVDQYLFAPLQPQFFGKAPIVKPAHVIVTEEGIDAITGDIRFDVAHYDLDAPEDYIVYHREFPDDGLFLPLSTTYNPTTGQVIAEMDAFGEYILAHPDLTSLVFPPMPFAPEDGYPVNSQESVLIRWTPIGYVNYYHLQVAVDDGFTQLIIDEPFMAEALFELFEVELGLTYYWRVNASNDAGQSGWSEVFTFIPSNPFITIESPNGGEEFQRGLDYFVTWDDNIPEDVAIDLSEAGQHDWEQLGIEPSLGGFQWEIDPALAVGAYEIRISSTENPGFFTIGGAFSVIDTTENAIEADESVASYHRALQQNYPNPFNPGTTIGFTISSPGQVTIDIFNSAGQRIRELVNRVYTVGDYTLTWDGRNAIGQTVASGVYFYTLSVEGAVVEQRKMTLLR